MPWRGVTVSEQRQRFLEDYQLNYYPVSELAERFSVSRKTAYPGLAAGAGKWINRFEEQGQSGFHEHSRRPHRSPSQTAPAISLDRTLEHFKGLLEAYGLPHRIRTIHRSPPAAWPGSRSCRCGSSSWGSTPS